MYTGIVKRGEIGQKIQDFWQQWEHFRNKTGKTYGKPYKWQNTDVTEGHSASWHGTNSFDNEKTLGYVACIVCSKSCGMGDAERNWGDVKAHRSGQKAHLGTDKLEKMSIISTSYNIETKRIKRRDYESMDCQKKRALWGDEDERYDLQLDKFDVDVDEISKIPSKPERIFRCWLEHWERPLLKNRKIDGKMKQRLIEKYKGLQFYDLDDEVPMMTCGELYWKKGRGGGWCIKSVPANWDGKDEDLIRNEFINEDVLIWMIARTKQPRELNVKKLKMKHAMKPGAEMKEVLSKDEETKASDDDSVSMCGTRLKPEVDV